MFRRASFTLLFVCLLATNALAWGNSGHRITAWLAQDRLSDDAEREMRRILGQQFISGVSTLPDAWRNNDGARFTAGWHFVNTSIDEESYDAARDCKGDQCVVEQINDMRDLLADKTQSDGSRREALIYLVHFIGDLHQPFHTGSGQVDGQPDRGGNRINVVLRGRNTNLHAAWDSGILELRGFNIQDYVDHLADEVVPTLDVNTITAGTVADWANESHGIAQDQRVEDETTLSAGYVTTAQGIVDERLARGAIRLAKVIEDALGGN
jgi:S1/P1 Nuclease